MKLVPTTALLVLFGAAVVPALTIGFAGFWPAPCAAAIAAVVALCFWDAWAGKRRLPPVRLTVPPLVRLWLERPGEIDLTIDNSDTRPRTLRVALALPEEITSPDGDAIGIALARGIERSHITWKCIGQKRGRYVVDAAVLERASPLRLWSVRATAPLSTEIRVYPTLTAEQKNAPDLFVRRPQVGLHMHRQVGKGREFEKLREYAPGDGFEDVDWKATARRGHPITRVFQVERTQEVYVVLDASRLTARPLAGGTASILERNITTSLLLALAAEKRGDLFGLATFSDSVHGFVRARSGKAHYGGCREALYALQPRIVSPDFDEVCTLLRLKLRRRALIVFLTELDDPALAESFLRNVNLLRRQHLVVVGMARPQGAEPVFSDLQVDTADDVYNRLAGQILWTRLRELGKTLDRQGVHFALLDPGTAGVQLASMYADIKQRQLL